MEDISYQFRFTSQVRNPNTFLYNTGPITTGLDDPNRNLYQTTPSAESRVGAPWFTSGPMYTMYDQRRSGVGTRYGGQGAVSTLFNRPGAGAVSCSRVRPTIRSFLDCVCSTSVWREPERNRCRQPRRINVHSIALRVPKASLRASSPIIGSGHSQPSDDDDPPERIRGSSGNFVQVSRLGCPLVNEWVIPVGRKTNGTQQSPIDDAQFLSYVTAPEVPMRLLDAVTVCATGDAA